MYEQRLHHTTSHIVQCIITPHLNAFHVNSRHHIWTSHYMTLHLMTYFSSHRNISSHYITSFSFLRWLTGTTIRTGRTTLNFRHHCGLPDMDTHVSSQLDVPAWRRQLTGYSTVSSISPTKSACRRCLWLEHQATMLELLERSPLVI